MMKRDFLDAYFKAARVADVRFPAALSDRIMSDAVKCLDERARSVRTARKWTFPKLRFPALLPSSLASAAAAFAVVIVLSPGEITTPSPEIASAPASITSEDDAIMLNAWLHGWTAPIEMDVTEDLLISAYLTQ